MDQERVVLLLPTRKGNESDRPWNGIQRRFFEESRKLWRVALPAMLSRVTQYGTFVVTQAFIGHIGSLELAAYALIQIIIIRFAHGILLGMTSATDTLCGQAFGAKQYNMMGIYLQRSLIINIAIATLLLPCFVFSSSIFKLLGQEGDVASIAGYMAIWFIPIMYFMGIHMTIEKYLQAQLKNTIVGSLSIFSFALHILLSWLLVTKLNLGIPGAMTAMILSNSVVLIGEFVYVFGGWCPHTWTGFSWAAFSHLIPVLKLSISSGIMLLVEVWYHGVLVLVAGYLQDATNQISAFSICVNITAWDFMLCAGFLAAISVRVGNELGKGDTEAAKFSIKVTLSTSVCIGIIFWILCLAFGNRIAYLFTSEEQVVKTVSNLSVLLAFSVLLNSAQPVLSGVAVGSGRQKMVAYINICSYYVVGLPIGLLLGYIAHLQVQGIWIGMIIGVLTQTLVLGYITMRTDWDEQVVKASYRLNRLLVVEV